MKLYLNSNGTLQVENKAISSKTSLVFTKYSEQEFSITDKDGASILPSEKIDLSAFKVYNNGSTAYSDVDTLYSAISDFFNAGATAEKQDDLLGRVSQIVTGVAEATIKAGYYAYGCTCRVADSKIASLKKIVGVTESPDNDESITGIAMFQGEYQPFVNKVVKVTQTNATDSITYWLKQL